MSRPARFRLLPVSIAFAVLAGLFGSVPHTVRGAVPGGSPVFTTPLAIDNEFFPLAIGTTKVFRGKDNGKKITVVQQCLENPEEFVSGGSILTRVLVEHEFRQGKLNRISTDYFAEADDGSVYQFGRLVARYDGGAFVSNEGSWFFGGQFPNDPVASGWAGAPVLAMPAIPELGDTIKPVDQFPNEEDKALVDETVLFEKIVKKVKVEAGVFLNVIQVKETGPLGQGAERKWYAEGVGLIRTKGGGRELSLVGWSHEDITR
ncbi:MAG: hypothetical protein JNL94_12110 [Planctomycetes bacterium]|nr:hypothetical protein [Planctomycetota bacterium]